MRLDTLLPIITAFGIVYVRRLVGDSLDHIIE